MLRYFVVKDFLATSQGVVDNKKCQYMFLMWQIDIDFYNIVRPYIEKPDCRERPTATQWTSNIPFPVRMLGLEVMTLQYSRRQITIQLSSLFVSLDDARNALISESVKERVDK